MASQNKKKKAKNSYIYNGGEKDTMKFKRLMYFNKKLRNKIKQDAKKMVNEME